MQKKRLALAAVLATVAAGFVRMGRLGNRGNGIVHLPVVRGPCVRIIHGRRGHRHLRWPVRERGHRPVRDSRDRYLRRRHYGGGNVRVQLHRGRELLIALAGSRARPGLGRGTCRRPSESRSSGGPPGVPAREGRSGGRGARAPRPPTPPDVRVRIRRFFSVLQLQIPCGHRRESEGVKPL